MRGWTLIVGGSYQRACEHTEVAGIDRPNVPGSHVVWADDPLKINAMLPDALVVLEPCGADLRRIATYRHQRGLAA